MTAELEGTRIVGDRVQWLDANQLYVPFVSGHTGKLHQLYAGCVYAGETRATEARSVIGLMPDNSRPLHLRVIAIDPGDAGKDFGDLLPPRPAALIDLEYSATDPDSDADRDEIFSGSGPGQAVDFAAPIAVVLRNVPGGGTTYTTRLPARAPGSWNFAVRPKDDKPADGNDGTDASFSHELVGYVLPAAPAPPAPCPELAYDNTSKVLTVGWEPSPDFV